MDACALAFAVLLLSMGYLGDRLGARRLYLGGMPLFALASVFCGRSSNALMLIVGRTLQGIGAAAMLPCSLALLSHATAHEHALRARAVGWWTASGAILPLTATFFGMNIFIGWLVGRTGARLPMVLGALIDATGFGLLLLPAFALLPGGMGLGMPAMTTTVLSAAEKQASGTASGMLNAARQAAGAIGVALFGSSAGSSNDMAVQGLHQSAWIALVMLMLVLAAVLALRGIRTRSVT